MAESMIGAKFRLNRYMLGNPAGTIGYVFNQYTDFDNPNWMGVQVIFPNGDYDGFSFEEQALYLDHVGWGTEKEKGYVFRNVMQVSRDFDNGFWNFSKEV